VTLGVIPGFGGTQNLARLIGPQKAKEMILSGRVLSAREAAEWGFVNAVFPAAELPLKAMEMARIIAGYGRVAAAAAKEAIVNGLKMTKEEAFEYESSLFAALFSTQDQKEGMRAFIEKRKAQFEDK
jgi:enoyl-CoA hydratase